MESVNEILKNKGMTEIIEMLFFYNEKTDREYKIKVSANAATPEIISASVQTENINLKASAIYNVKLSKLTFIIEPKNETIKAALRRSIKHYARHNQIKLNLVLTGSDDNGGLVYTDNLNRYFLENSDGFYSCSPEYFEPECSIDMKVFEEMFNSPFKMRTVKVKFADSQYNFTTQANGTILEINRYFKQGKLNVGSYPVENMQSCSRVEITA